jgi:hypothetical protein
MLANRAEHGSGHAIGWVEHLDGTRRSVIVEREQMKLTPQRGIGDFNVAARR